MVIEKQIKEELKGYLEVYNEVYGNNYKVYTAYVGNWKRIREFYTAEEIYEAVRLAPEAFWAKDPGPALLLRGANSRGGCDYIGDILNAPEEKEHWSQVAEEEGIEMV